MKTNYKILNVNCFVFLGTQEHVYNKLEIMLTNSFGNLSQQPAMPYLFFMICYIAIKMKIRSSKGKLIYHGNLV